MFLGPFPSALTLLLLPALGEASAPDSLAEAAIAARVEIVRTHHGVPHILAEDFEALGFALAWVQSEDYGDVVARGMVQVRGEYGWHFGHDSPHFDDQAAMFARGEMKRVAFTDDEIAASAVRRYRPGGPEFP
jgi:acyl-homoserine lactone acylase PvdQ